MFDPSKAESNEVPVPEPTEEGIVEEFLVEEILVEEVSIDGMCGVY